MGFTNEYCGVYIMCFAYSFTFDPHVHELFLMHKSCAHDLDSWYDVYPCAIMLMLVLLEFFGDLRVIV